MTPAPRVLIVGAGLTGCTLAHRFGVETVLLEREPVPGGLIRWEHMNGVLYEPHGSDIDRQSNAAEIHAQLAERRHVDAAEKQWGRDASGQICEGTVLGSDDCMRQAIDTAAEVMSAL